MKRAQMIKAFSTIALMAALCGCFKISLHNGYASNTVREGSTDRVTAWHQIGILDLVEFSAPVDPTKVCAQREWATVDTQVTFLQAFVSILTEPFYGPREVSVSCR